MCIYHLIYLFFLRNQVRGNSKRVSFYSIFKEMFELYLKTTDCFASILKFTCHFKARQMLPDKKRKNKGGSMKRRDGTVFL